MIDTLFGISWAAPFHIVWAIPVLVVSGMLLWRLRFVHVMVDWLVHEEHQKKLIFYFSWQRMYIKTGLMIIALVLLVIALMRPQWDKNEEKQVQQGRDLVIALDISRSMLAQDYQPSRLEYAKEKIKKLVQLLEAERVALLVFSGDAVMQCPLTTDKAAFFMFLDAISVETISSGTTSYSAALEKVIELFSSFEAQREKLVALFTDGEDFSPDSQALTQKIVASSIHVCTIGVATPEGAPIPLYDQKGSMQGFQKDNQNNVVISRLNAKLMQELAAATKGMYVLAQQGDEDLQKIKRWIESFEKSSWQERQACCLQDKYYYYAALAWIMLLIEWLL